jgi:orotidine-5'-phosphate decarboxylase
MSHFADRIVTALEAKGNALCVGLDPRWDDLPRSIREKHGTDGLDQPAAAYEEFCARVIDLVAPLVPVIKLQSAFFEACGPAGFAAQQRLLRTARERGLLTILDAKRNDIGSTAEAYAAAAFEGTEFAGRLHPVWDADALTVNPYLGRDAVEPFLARARRAGRGVFVLVRTSNPGARLFQDLDCGGRPLFHHVGAAVLDWARERLGASGFGDVGAVVGATYPAELVDLRRLLPEVLFLVPGFGAQGGTAADVAAAFRPDGLGALVSSSRGITRSFHPNDVNWEAAILSSVRLAIQNLAESTPMGKLAKSTHLLPNLPS